MAANLFSRAAAYRKKHKGMTMPEAVKALSKKSAPKKATRSAHKKTAHKKAAVGKVRRKAAAKPARKVKIKIKPGKKGTFNLGIGGVAHDKIGQELRHQHALTSALNKHRGMLATKGLKVTEKAAIKRDIAHYRNAIAASKKHISALKRSL